MYLYQRRVLALEKEFRNARRELRRLLRQARFKPDSVKSSAVKTQLDLINALIRSIKEETAFFVKLGQLYDFSRLCDDFLEMLKRQDPDLADSIIIEIDKIWTREYPT
jgi:hypothetical protein